MPRMSVNAHNEDWDETFLIRAMLCYLKLPL